MRFGDADSALTAVERLVQVPSGVTPGDLRFSPSWDLLAKIRASKNFSQEKS